MTMKARIGLLASALVFLFATVASAHFGMLIPDTDEVTQEKRDINLTLSFSHPFEMVGMELEKPAEFLSSRTMSRRPICCLLSSLPR